MNPCFILILAVVAFCAFVGSDIKWVYPAHKEFAKFAMQCVVSAFTLIALLVALFRNYLQQLVDPIRLNMEVPEESNTVLDSQIINNVPRDVYCHHLKVVNLTSHQSVRNCRVWLKAVYTPLLNQAWGQPFRFAVPRLMEWAPNEISKNERSFSKEQVIDLGKTIGQNGGFIVSFNKDQGGTFTSAFAINTRARFVFFVSADNYPQEKVFTFEVSIPASIDGQQVTPSTVIKVENFNT
jgi:hypothetical protein